MLVRCSEVIHNFYIIRHLNTKRSTLLNILFVITLRDIGSGQLVLDATKQKVFLFQKKLNNQYIAKQIKGNHVKEAGSNDTRSPRRTNMAILAQDPN